jgi:hypothetical protein
VLRLQQFNVKSSQTFITIDQDYSNKVQEFSRCMQAKLSMVIECLEALAMFLRSFNCTCLVDT